MDNLHNAPPVWPALPARYSDGIVGATFGDIAVSTPNAEVMYRPLVDQPASVILNEDFRFGLHDPTTHPQPLHNSSRYLVAMLAPTMDGVDHVLFRPFSLSDWTPSTDDQAFTGLGTLDKKITGMLVEHGRQLLTRLKQAADDASANPNGPVKSEHLKNERMEREIWYFKMYHRLVRRAASFDECHFRWVNVQRLHLNLQAYLDYITIFLPRFRSLSTKPLPVDASRAGCITTSLSYAMECYFVGLPVWYIFKATGARPSLFKRYLGKSEVQALLCDTCIPVRAVQMGASRSNDGSFSLAPAPGAQVLWMGQADDPARYVIMSKVLRGEYSYKQQLSPPQSNTQPSSSAAPLAGSSSSNPKRPRSPSPDVNLDKPSKISRSKKRSKKTPHTNATPNNRSLNVERDRWKDIRSPITPAGIDWWTSLLEEEKHALHAGPNVEISFPGVCKPHTFYAAPDGFIFAEMEMETTQAGSLVNYVRLRPLIHYRLDSVTDPLTSVKSLRAQSWRTMLGLGVLGAGKAGSRASIDRLAAINNLRDTMAEAQLEVSIDLTNLRSVPAQWKDGNVLRDDGVLPPVSVCREIIWEMYELNFRSELVLLDAFVFDWARNRREREEARARETKEREEERARQGGNAREAEEWLEAGELLEVGDLSAAERRLAVLNMIPHFKGNVVVDNDDFQSRGFAAPTATERKIALCGLVAVMRGWGGDASLPLEVNNKANVFEGITTVFGDEILEFSKLVGRYYIKCYYKVFARAPTLPRRLQAQI